MDNFGFGVLGGIFVSGGVKNEEQDAKQKTTPRFDAVDYTPPDIAGFQQPSLSKQQKQTFVDTLIPVKVGQILKNIGDGSQKFVLYNQSIGGMCLVGQAQSVEKLTSAVHFHLVDETGDVTVNYTNEASQLIQGQYVQVVGSLVVLAADNFYVDAQHVMVLDVDEEKYQDIIKYHNVSVANVAFHLDIGAKLKLQNKLSGKITDLPGQRTGGPTLGDISSVQLDAVHDHVSDPVERLVLQYLKSRQDTLAKRRDIIACLSEQYVETAIEAAIARLEAEAEIACTKDLVCLPI